MGRFDGKDLTNNQIDGLLSFIYGPTSAVLCSIQKLHEAGLSDAEISDLVGKGYLVSHGGDRYLIPLGVLDMGALISRKCDVLNKERANQMIKGML